MRPDDLSDRMLGFAVRVINLVEAFPEKRGSSRRIGEQLLRSGTSPGANYEEARAAESREDFVHKAQIALKELRESRYWIRLATHSTLIEAERVAPLLQECEELMKIVGKTIVTVKRTAGLSQKH